MTIANTSSIPTANIVVVGGGLAGLSAFIHLHEIITTKPDAWPSVHYNVTLLEKEANLGGNSMKATSGMNGIHTRAQKNANITDTEAEFFQDSLKSSHHLSNLKLLRTLVSQSHDAIDWIEKFGVPLDSVSQCGGHSKHRTHKEASRSDGKPAAVGYDIIQTLKKHIDNYILTKNALNQDAVNDKPWDFHIQTQARLQELVYEQNRDDQITVKGVKYTIGQDRQEEHVLSTKAVILATGGFSHDFDSPDSLIKAFVPHLGSFSTTNGKWASGDGVKIARKIGAGLSDMNMVQLHPTAFVDPKDVSNRVKFLAPEALRAHGGILIDPSTGHRFVNELETRDVVSSAIQNLDQDTAIKPFAEAVLVMNEHVVTKFDKAAVQFYMKKGLVQSVQGVNALAEMLHLDPLVITETLYKYNTHVESNTKDAFGKKVYPTKFDANEIFCKSFLSDM